MNAVDCLSFVPQYIYLFFPSPGLLLLEAIFKTSMPSIYAEPTVNSISQMQRDIVYFMFSCIIMTLNALAKCEISPFSLKFCVHTQSQYVPLRPIQPNLVHVLSQALSKFEFYWNL